MPHILIINWIRLNLAIHSIFEIIVVKFLVWRHTRMTSLMHIVMILMGEIIISLEYCLSMLSHHSSLLVGGMIIEFGITW